MIKTNFILTLLCLSSLASASHRLPSMISKASGSLTDNPMTKAASGDNNNLDYQRIKAFQKMRGKSHPNDIMNGLPGMTSTRKGSYKNV